ncbi:MAG: hypothetical protein GTN35_05070 [Nitrososphaeria archaeon]|nr:hypothetical protein [Nitrosopumilaceae archaeon]NIP09426.1 hypothetical protein [Nitrosopumilaceae archaeon]NIP91749.1 hypothetical protein [Nitrososphaeria archaeon]NIS95642.1 hypothetical protein [Nitrosopumilaceae archaeon]
MLSIFIIFPFFLFPVFAEQIPDYEKPYSPIFTDKPAYSWTDKMKITILAPSWNSDRYLIDSIGDDNYNPIKIYTSENSLEPYRFTETGPNTGIFTAEVILTGFPHDVDGDGDTDTTPRTLGTGPTSGFLETDRDSAVTISFEFADGVVLTESVPIFWNIGNTQFTEENYLSDKSAMIRVIDPDLNLNPEALDQISVEVSSDSDAAGIEVDAIETSESSGVFVATISFTQNLSSSGNRLLAFPGDEIYAKYIDYTLPKPYSTSDNLEIISLAKLNSAIPTLERVSNLPISLADNFGNPLDSFYSNTRIQVVGSVINEQNFNQQFVYLIQVKNQKEEVVSLSWISGELDGNQNLDVSQSWIPKNSGVYAIQTFVWNSLSEQVPLSNFTATTITVE